MTSNRSADRQRPVHHTERERLSAIAIREDVGSEIWASRRAPAGLHSDAEVEQWIARQRGSGSMRVQIVPLDSLRSWAREEGSGDLIHKTGRFFSVLGLDVLQRGGLEELAWNQPIIEQPEVGILGIMAKRISGVLHFCLQAKEEPGNIGGVLLSPTVQATFSNYIRVHRGSEPPFLSLFTAAPPQSVVFSRLQTEDGGRFLFKSNRNMIVLAGDEVPVALPERFVWLTLNQIAALLRRDNLVNACARSILSALACPWSKEAWPATTSGSERGGGDTRTISDTLQWLDDMRAYHHVKARRIGLDELGEWEWDTKGFFAHRDGRFFRILGLSVLSSSREIHQWDQPIIENATRGTIGLLVREQDGVRECLVQARAEPGNRPTVQIAPTVQFTPGNYHGNTRLARPFLFDEFSGSIHWPRLSESLQAEEGARFFRECHRHRVLLLPQDEDVEIPFGYRWIPEAHLRFLLHLGEQVNSCARSIIGCLL